jgi:hypothetical protein
MIMTVNEALIKQNFISKILLKKDENELSKGLKVKIMGIRIKLSKVRKEFDEDVQEAIKGFTPEGFAELAQKQDKTEEEVKNFEEMNKKINDEYQAYIIKRGQEEVSIDAKLTEDEYNELIEVNADNDVEINGQKLNAADFLEILYALFVEE